MSKTPLLIMALVAQSIAGIVTLSIDHIDTAQRGALLIEVCPSGVPFPCHEAQAVAKARLNVTSETLHYTLVLPDGTYAVAVVHDTNNNGLLDTNFLGMPKEGYALSGSRPSFERSKVLIDHATQLDLHMRY